MHLYMIRLFRTHPSLNTYPLTPSACLLSALTISFGGIVTVDDDDICMVLLLACKETAKNILGARGITSLGVEGRATVMRHHTVTSPQLVLHRPPRVVLGSWLNIPDVTGVTGELAALEGCLDGHAVADSTTGGVDEPSTLLEVLEEFGIDETAGSFVQGAVDGDDIAHGDHFLKRFDPASLDSGSGLLGKRSVVEIDEFFTVKGHETLEDTVTDTTGTDGADDFAFEIKRVTSDGRDLPVAALDHLVCGDKVAHEEKDRHDDVFCNGDDV